MSGKVVVEGHGEYDITVQGVRDHSYGECRMQDFENESLTT